MPTRIYLDHAATTPLRPEAKAAMEEGFALWANPSSPHAEGRKARAALEDARERIKAALGWEGELIFTSGASEALAIGLGRAKAERRIVSAVEHDAVFRAAPDAEVVPVAARGLLDRDALARGLAGGPPAVVALQHLNSEIGLVQTGINEIAQQVREAGSLLLSDCSQSAGKLPLPAADMIVCSAHKFGGPIGIGALLVRDFAMLAPSGGQERGYRSGTENLPSALGFAASIEACGMTRGIPHGFDHLHEATLMLDQAVLAAGGTLVTADGPICETIDALAMPRLSAAAQLIRLDAAGFAVSAGSACSSGSLKRSRALAAFGVPEDIAERTIRVSFGWSTTSDEIYAFAQAWRKIAEEVKASAA